MVNDWVSEAALYVLLLGADAVMEQTPTPLTVPFAAQCPDAVKLTGRPAEDDALNENVLPYCTFCNGAKLIVCDDKGTDAGNLLCQHEAVQDHVAVILAAHQVDETVANQAHIPVGWTLLGTGAFPVTDPMALQMVGFMGAGYTNKAVCEADVLIMIGMRCDDRVTTRLDSFAPRVEHLVHIDIDPAEIGKNVIPHVSVVADAKVALRELNLLVEPKREHAGLTQIDQWKEEHPVRYTNHNGLLQPQEVLEAMYARCEDEAIVLADVGQNQIWAALWFNYNKPGLFLNSGGTGTMGYAFPASMGVKLANPGKTVFCVTGEGGFVMNMQEMATMVENNIDVNVVILNNSSLGMVRQFQDDFYDGVRSAVDLTFTPDFVKLGDAFGMKAMSTERIEDVGRLLDEAMAHKGPVLLNFNIDPNANVYPIVPLGKGMLDFVEAS